jgi:uncharacterized membrane protein
MTVDSLARLRINRPQAEVASYLRDPDNDPRWIGGISSARLLTPEPIDVGAQVERVASFLGRRIEYVNQIVELGPDQLVMRSVRSPFPMRVTYGFAAAGPDATDVSVRVEGDASGLYSLAGPLLNRAVTRNISGDLRRLKRLLEGAPAGVR